MTVLHQRKWSKAWNSYKEAHQIKSWFPKPNVKKCSILLGMDWNNLSQMVQFLTGHNKLKRHKNIQDRVENIYSCRLCEEDEESSFHVISECPAMQLHRTRVDRQQLALPTYKKKHLCPPQSF